MPQKEIPKLPDQDKPFWLARPNIENETRIIFQTAKPRHASAMNAFSAWEVLRAAHGETPPLVLSPTEAIAQALVLGTTHQAAIDGLRKILKQRTTDPTLRVIESEYAIFGHAGKGMHRFGD